MLRNSSSSPSLWTWEEILSKCPSKCAAPVSAFQFQKAPLAPYWDEITDGEIVGEVDLQDLTSGLRSSNSYKQRLSITKRKRNERNVIKYWFVKVVQHEGYNLKVRFLGFPLHLQDKVMEHERWINYNQLKSFGYHVDIGGDFSAPRLSDDDIIPEPREIMLKRLKDAYPTSISTVNPVMMGSIEKEEKEFRWKKMFTRVEVRNSVCCTEMLPGYISKTCGRRLQATYWCTPDPAFKGKGTWVHEDSDLIQPEGWTKTAGAKMNISVEDYYPAPLEPSKLGHDIQQGASIDIKVDMMFELINPLKLDEIAVGQVSRVLSHGYFTCDIVSIVDEDDLNSYASGVNDGFHFHITSDQLFPLGSFVGETPPVKPWDAENDDDFTWASYLENNGYEKLPLPHKNNDGHGFEENMLIEAVDALNPELVCPAKILKIVHPYAMKIRFLGWDSGYDQWKPIKSLEIFPVGWCQFRDYPLEPPPIPVPAVEAPISQNTVVAGSSVRVNSGRGKSSKRQPTGTGAALVDQVSVESPAKDNLKKWSKSHSVPENRRPRGSSTTRSVCATSSYYNLRPRPPRVSGTDNSAKSQVLSLTKENLEKLKMQSRSVSRPAPDNKKKKVSHPRKSRSLLTSFSRL